MPAKRTPKTTPTAAAPAAGPAPVEHAVAEMARHVQSLAVALAARPAELEAKVAALEAEAAALRADREQLLRLKALYERKFEAMKAKA